MEEGIARCALFAGMRAEEVEGLLGRLACTRRQYEKGEVLLHAGYENRKKMTGQRDAGEFLGLVGASVAHLAAVGSQNPVRYVNC